MDITIALATLNEEENIRGCLNNLKKRIKEYNSGDVELIILDSYSEDKTVEIAQSFDVVDEIYKIPKGILTARNECFKKASNNIVVFVDADARYREKWLPRLIKPFEDDEVIATYGKAKGKGLEIFTRAVFNKLVIDCFMPGANRAIKKGVYFELGGYKILEDQRDLWKVMIEELYRFPRELRKKGGVIHVPNAVNYQSGRNLDINRKEGGAQWNLTNFQSQWEGTWKFLKYASGVKKKQLKKKFKRLKGRFESLVKMERIQWN